jgi:hypothetical protein
MTDNKLISRALAALRNVKRSEIVFMKSLWRKVALGRVYAGVNEGMIRGILKT